MTLTQITYFTAVCEYKNVTKAANALFVSRTAVSRALKDLENEWDLVLFKRSRTGVELTEDGERVRDIFTDFNNAYMALKKSVNDRRRAQNRQELRIGITTTTGSMFFPEFFGGFTQLYPDIRLRFTEHNAFDSINAMLSGAIDFFITPHIINESAYNDVIEKVATYTTELVYCVSLQHPLSTRMAVTDAEIDPLEKASLLTPLPSGDLTDDELRQLLNDEEGLFFIRTSQQQLLHKIVAEDFSTIVLPREIAEGWNDIRMIPFEPPKKFPVYIIWDKTLKPTNAHKAFQQYVKQYNYQNYPR